MAKKGRPQTDFSVLNYKGRLRYGTDRRWVVADPQNPEALIHHVWDEFAQKIEILDKEMPEVWRYTERKMHLWVRPSKMLDQLRCIFWARVYEGRALGLKVKREEILIGLIDDKVWSKLIDDQKNLAYLIRPIPRIEAAFESLMWRSLRHLQEWLDEPRDFKAMSPGDSRSFIQNVFEIMYECEKRIHSPTAANRRLVMKDRAELIKNIKADGAELNIHVSGDEEISRYDLDLLPEEREEDGDNRSDQGDEFDSLPGERPKESDPEEEI